MSTATTIRFQFDWQGLDWTDLEPLFRAGGLGGRKGEKIRRAFQNSEVMCFATDGPRLIGAGRAISDGEYHGIIYDVVVHPDYQRQRVGARLMKAIIERLPVWRIILVADKDVQPFYAKLGFQPFEGVMARFDPGKLYEAPSQSSR